nr:TIGR03084 family metal-binding protein [Pseudomonadota bacterium]
MVMIELASDLREEGNELYAFLSSLSAEDWRRPTPFKSWTTQDIMQHLIVGDWFNTLSMTEPDRFVELMQRRTTARAAGAKSSGVEYLDEPIAQGRDLLSQWHGRFNHLCDLFNAADAKTRMKWVGPDMSIRSAATARLMETWAHGQDVYDLVQVDRGATDRIRHIAVLGVNTYGWTFQNRNMQAPGPAPCVQLVAPSGAQWRWNETNDKSKVSGPALDFCHVVTQGRHVEETSLEVTGDTAVKWMAIAQCFAGPAEDPPTPGLRGSKR